MKNIKMIDLAAFAFSLLAGFFTGPACALEGTKKAFGVPAPVVRAVQNHPAFQNWPDVAVTYVRTRKNWKPKKGVGRGGVTKIRDRFEPKGPFITYRYKEFSGTPGAWTGKTTYQEIYKAGIVFARRGAATTYYAGKYESSHSTASRITSIDEVQGKLFPLKLGNKMVIAYTRKQGSIYKSKKRQEPRRTASITRWLVTWEVVARWDAAKFKGLAKRWPQASGYIYRIKKTKRKTYPEPKARKNIKPKPNVQKSKFYYSPVLGWVVPHGIIRKLRTKASVARANFARLVKASPKDFSNLGHRAYGARNYRLALKYLAPLVRTGLTPIRAKAQLYVGYIYHNGRGGIKRNRKLAVLLYAKSAAAGNLNAEVAIGRAFYYGTGLRQNRKKGIKILFRAVGRGSKYAKASLIRMAQNALKNRGYKPGAANGKMVNKTRDAIMAYRRMAKIPGRPGVDQPLMLSLAKPVMRGRSFRPKKMAPDTAPNLPVKRQPNPASKQTMEVRLKRLKAMLQKGLITKKEAATKRTQILQGL